MDEQFDAEKVADEILADVGDEMAELYAALPDLIHDRSLAYRLMRPVEQIKAVQAVARVIGGEGYEYTYPMP